MKVDKIDERFLWMGKKSDDRVIYDLIMKDLKNMPIDLNNLIKTNDGLVYTYYRGKRAPIDYEADPFGEETVIEPGKKIVIRFVDNDLFINGIKMDELSYWKKLDIEAILLTADNFYDIIKKDLRKLPIDRFNFNGMEIVSYNNGGKEITIGVAGYLRITIDGVLRVYTEDGKINKIKNRMKLIRQEQTRERDEENKNREKLANKQKKEEIKNLFVEKFSMKYPT